MSGCFIVFEGGEGAGKTLQASQLGIDLTRRGFDIVLTSEPGGTEIGQSIRGLLLDPTGPPIPPMAELMLYAADRAAHVAEVVRPALEAGKVVISDRYTDSTIAYQGAGRGLAHAQLVSDVAAGFLRPNLTVLLDIDPQVGLQRARRRSPADRLETETLEFHQRVRAAFLDRATASLRDVPSLDAYMIVDATVPADVISVQVVDRVSELLAARKITARASA